MRQRFEQQLSFGQLPIEETPIPAKNKNQLDELLAALKAVYCHKDYNSKLFRILEDCVTKNKKRTGRKGMDLWCIFVLSQIRMCLNTNYSMVHNLANNHRTLRQLMGIEKEFGYNRQVFEYQNIYDNLNLITDDVVRKINDLIVEFGHKEVFKKKETTALRLKTDSFVVESNVHFPTDYNLLWDCVRKCIDTVAKILDQYDGIPGWRKIEDWKSTLKGLMREVGKVSSSGGQGKEERLIIVTKKYLVKARLLLKKLDNSLITFPQESPKEMALVMSLLCFMELMEKHIDLVERRIIKGETIPHEEKLFSIFETYTEWIKKGKSRPSVELGKKLVITTDQFNLIIDYQLLSNQQEREIAIEIADRVLAKFKKIQSMSFDKGFWKKENKALMQLEIPEVIMPKLGKRTKEEEKEEKSTAFKKQKNKHSAIESNINELENRGLDRCPDRGLPHFKRYVGLAICAYNLKKIGRQILKIQLAELEENSRQQKKAA